MWRESPYLAESVQTFHEGVCRATNGEADRAGEFRVEQPRRDATAPIRNLRPQWLVYPLLNTGTGTITITITTTTTITITIIVMAAVVASAYLESIFHRWVTPT